jgi:hypothetical protein
VLKNLSSSCATLGSLGISLSPPGITFGPEKVALCSTLEFYEVPLILGNLKPLVMKMPPEDPPFLESSTVKFDYLDSNAFEAEFLISAWLNLTVFLR